MLKTAYTLAASIVIALTSTLTGGVRVARANDPGGWHLNLDLSGLGELGGFTAPSPNIDDTPAVGSDSAAPPPESPIESADTAARSSSALAPDSTATIAEPRAAPVLLPATGTGARRTPDVTSITAVLASIGLACASAAVLIRRKQSSP